MLLFFSSMVAPLMTYQWNFRWPTIESESPHNRVSHEMRGAGCAWIYQQPSNHFYNLKARKEKRGTRFPLSPPFPLSSHCILDQTKSGTVSRHLPASSHIRIFKLVHSRLVSIIIFLFSIFSFLSFLFWFCVVGYVHFQVYMRLVEMR